MIGTITNANELKQVAEHYLKLNKYAKVLDTELENLKGVLNSYLDSMKTKKTEIDGITIELEKCESFGPDPSFVLSNCTFEEIKELASRCGVSFDKETFEQFVKEQHPGWSPYVFLKLMSSYERLLVKKPKVKGKIKDAQRIQ